MISDDFKKQLPSTTTRAMRFYLDNRIIPVITKKDGKAIDVGSGTYIKIDNHHFLATAGHVLQSIEDPSKTIVLSGSGRPAAEISSFIKYNYEDNSRGIDVGYIEFSNDDAKKLNKDYIELSSILVETPFVSKDVVMVCGYPVEVIEIENTNKNRILTLRAIHFLTNSIMPEDWPSSITTDTSIMLKYPIAVNNSKGNLVKIPDALGISGGGIWKLNVNATGIWSTERARLIGIQSKWNRKKRYLIGVQIQYLLEMIDRDYPGLNLS